MIADLTPEGVALLAKKMRMVAEDLGESDYLVMMEAIATMAELSTRLELAKLRQTDLTGDQLAASLKIVISAISEALFALDRGKSWSDLTPVEQAIALAPKPELKAALAVLTEPEGATR
jgi:hypothetical protein